MTLGAVADDLTGAIDLGAAVVRAGRSAVVTTDPNRRPESDGVDVAISALRTRTAPVHRAIGLSVFSARRLLEAGADRIFFKYCSTFDSTLRGNIGPVADALLELTDTDLTIVCPAHPINGRTVSGGHLFVNGVPLAESSMATHPLTPMLDSDVATLLSRQSIYPVGNVDTSVVEAGPQAIRRRIDQLLESGIRYAVTDAATSQHLSSIAKAATGDRLITGAAGLGGALAELLGSGRRESPQPEEGVTGVTAILAGSCAAATLAQVEEAGRRYPSRHIDPLDIAVGHDVAGDAVAWAGRHLGERAILLYSSVYPDRLRIIQRELGRDGAAAVVETTFGKIATDLADLGVRNFIVAGGETAGSVVEALGITLLRLRAEIEPGVAWAVSEGRTHVRCALKSGNFGSRDFFNKACEAIA